MPYIIDPRNKYKVGWDVFIGLIYQACYIIDPYVFAANFEPLRNTTLFIF